ncbi:MAG TPA: GNAT family N-acetyltransferase [Acidimicrobiales bacterium]|nr:GNAT family N-acetyltransferase [Acidimicrobiales bacterium]
MTNTASRGRVRLRIGPWHGDDHVVLVAPMPDSLPPTVDVVSDCCRQLARRGVERVVTGALGPDEQRPFLEAGFTEHERLHLLAHDLVHLPHIETVAHLRRARRHDRPTVLDIDSLAFDEFWRLDDAGLTDAISATPVARFRVAVVGNEIVGYAVCGRAATRGYVQRLAVHPAWRAKGVGAALVVDGLAWMRRHRCTQAMVNTQLANDRALALYQSLGFEPQVGGLVVLTRTLDRST